jgi:hypothetical protein
LYGLKQSPRQWYKRFDSFMIGHGYTRSSYDSYVYYRQLADSSFVYLLLYVDDMLITAKSMFEIKRLKSLLGDEFEMKDLGAAKKILGMEIHRCNIPIFFFYLINKFECYAKIISHSGKITNFQYKTIPLKYFSL